MAKDKFLAVAFSDLNGNDNYNPTQDVLIAAIVDTNHDRTVSVGDTVQFGTYPQIADGINSGHGGTFNGTDQTITSVVLPNSTSVVVSTAGGSMSWTADADLQHFQTLSTGGQTESSLVDYLQSTTAQDLIFVDSSVSGPG